MTRRRSHIVGFLFFVLLFLMACGGGGGVQPSATNTPTFSPFPTEPGPFIPPNPPTPPPPPPGAGDATRGAPLAVSNGCPACHDTSQGITMVGPTWKGLYGRQRTLSDGSTVMADEAYISESISNSGAKVVKDFTPGLMPEYGPTLTAQDIADILAFIKTLR